jgi:E3 ubiquitin-protein ligase RBBP6
MFDGSYITVAQLKQAIFHQKKLGKTPDVDLVLTNASTKEEYRDEGFLVPKNTSVTVRRVPLSATLMANFTAKQEKQAAARLAEHQVD